jgi:hypothetical protein
VNAQDIVCAANVMYLFNNHNKKQQVEDNPWYLELVLLAVLK